jgi:hypothetical protein
MDFLFPAPDSLVEVILDVKIVLQAGPEVSPE